VSFVSDSFQYFLPIFFILWLLSRRAERTRTAIMLAGSLLFYAYNRWWTLGVIVSYCVVDWGVGLLLARVRRRRLVLVLGLAFNIGVLAFWKYTPFIVSNIAAAVGVQPPFMPLIDNWVVPLGISFFSFSGITYMVDVYNGSFKPERSLWRYSLFTAFFPHLVAGPILRAREFLAHVQPGELPAKPVSRWEGAFLIARGYFKKLVLADTIAVAIDPFFANVAYASTDGVWSLPYVYLYAFQIYFDFSGYTDIARGLGLWFGFRWPDNFNWPYLAASIQEFWRRWHMTLSRFLRDYLYVPLGGNRKGSLRTVANLMVTMLLGGIWHGAGWSFAVWGLLHGTYLVVNHGWQASSWRSQLARLHGPAAGLYRAICMAVTFQAVCFAWCFFRLTNFDEALACIKKLVVFEPARAFAGGDAEFGTWFLLAAYGIATVGAVLLGRGAPLASIEQRLGNRPVSIGFCWGIVCGMLVLALTLAPGRQTSPFIYFRF
jgi:alginate O-acetyltransferase complex protein AlgI